MPFTIADIPDLADKTILITGANSGLGWESAKALAGHGAHVIIAARSREKAAQAIDTIRQEHAAARLDVLELDLADLTSVRRSADEIKSRYPRLDVLMNNAGVMAVPYTRTKDGFELQFGTNHLGHFALTGLLFELLVASAARVVNVSSGAHKIGKMRFHDPHWQRGYAKWPAYGMSKLANLLFTYELARRIRIAGLPVRSVAAHPGYAATNLQLRGPEMARSKLGVALYRGLNAAFGQSAAAGALPQIYAAVSSDVESGDYIGPGRAFETRGHPKKVRSSARAQDTDAMKELWALSEELTGVRFAPLS